MKLKQKKIDITVVGAGYVGLSNALLLAKRNNIKILDIDKKKIEKINKRISPIEDKEIKEALQDENINITATEDKIEAYHGAEYVIIATPTDYSIENGSFDTRSIESVLNDLKIINPDAIAIIKSTVPIGYTEKIKEYYNTKNIIFSPEFLREGKALLDNLNPSRIVIGENSKRGRKFVGELQRCALKKRVKKIFTSNTEAEAIKLFSNTYLAMRVAFFNELDTYAATCKLEAKKIIEGVCSDKRIGMHYNNPSFGYGGYCLPKDSKQLLSEFNKIPQELITATVKANDKRKYFIANEIIKKQKKKIGVFRLAMKKDSDNLRQSSTLDIISILQKHNLEVIIYEPDIDLKEIHGCRLIGSLRKFKNEADVIVANRDSNELSDVKLKVFTRDIFYEN